MNNAATTTLTTKQIRARARNLSRHAPARLHEMAASVLATKHPTSVYGAFAEAHARWMAR